MPIICEWVSAAACILVAEYESIVKDALASFALVMGIVLPSIVAFYREIRPVLVGSPRSVVNHSPDLILVAAAGGGHARRGTRPHRQDHAEDEVAMGQPRR